MGEALAALHRRCDQVRFLGSYPRAGNGDGRRPAPATAPLPLGDAGDRAFAAA